MIRFNEDGKLVEPALRSELIDEIKRLQKLIVDIKLIPAPTQKKIADLVMISESLERSKEPDIFNFSVEL